MSSDFPDGIKSYTCKYAVIPLYFPDGIERCAYCYSWFRQRKVAGNDVFWCDLRERLGMAKNFISNPNAQRDPDFCPLVDYGGT